MRIINIYVDEDWVPTTPDKCAFGRQLVVGDDGVPIMSTTFIGPVSDAGAANEPVAESEPLEEARTDIDPTLSGLTKLQTAFYDRASYSLSDMETLSRNLLDTMVGAYQDEMQRIVATVLSEEIPLVLTSREMYDKLSKASEIDAKSVVTTYNRELLSKIEDIGDSEGPVTRDDYKRGLSAWELDRAHYKEAQIKSWSSGTGRHLATQEFYERNKDELSGEETAILEGPDPVCDFCRGWMNRGRVPAAEAAQVMFPAHPNCRHRWEFDWGEHTQLGFEDLWTGCVPLWKVTQDLLSSIRMD